MKILLLADINSPHIEKWATSLSGRGLQIAIFSLSAPKGSWHQHYGIEIFVPARIDSRIFSSGLYRKRKYLLYVGKLKKVIRRFRPDIVHAHYASSYGFLGTLSGFHPFVISVWGSDINFFARTPVLGRFILKFNFSRAERILSTSRAMVPSILRFTNKEVLITPFGIDTDTFHPAVSSLPVKTEIMIGTIKSLEEVYGIDDLLHAFARLKERLPSRQLKLMIVGGGSLENDLKTLAGNLGISQDTDFTGQVPYREVPDYLHKLDIYAALSISESFGVAVLEASSCGIPVVVSDAGGLPEVVENGKTGFVVPSKDSGKAAEALERLVLSAGLRREMGINGRKRVLEFYKWSECVDKMTEIYSRVYGEHKSKNH
jgi:glycosyltransferase involved in cell wall biosynthesis